MRIHPLFWRILIICKSWTIKTHRLIPNKINNRNVSKGQQPDQEQKHVKIDTSVKILPIKDTKIINSTTKRFYDISSWLIWIWSICFRQTSYIQYEELVSLKWINLRILMYWKCKSLLQFRFKIFRYFHSIIINLYSRRYDDENVCRTKWIKKIRIKTIKTIKFLCWILSCW